MTLPVVILREARSAESKNLRSCIFSGAKILRLVSLAQDDKNMIDIQYYA